MRSGVLRKSAWDCYDALLWTVIIKNRLRSWYKIFYMCVSPHCVSCVLTVRSAPGSSIYLSSLSLLSNFAGVFSSPRVPAPRAPEEASERVFAHFDDRIFVAGRNAGDIATIFLRGSRHQGDRTWRVGREGDPRWSSCENRSLSPKI